MKGSIKRPQSPCQRRTTVEFGDVRALALDYAVRTRREMQVWPKGNVIQGDSLQTIIANAKLFEDYLLGRD